MAKLHEIIAVDKDNRGMYDKLMSETNRTFKERHDHFRGLIKTYESVDADADYERDPERKEMVDTVPSKLSYFEESIASVIDVSFKKESTNCVAKSDIIVIEPNGVETLIAEAVPVTFLVQLEKQIQSMRNQIYNIIPTLDDAIPWTWNNEQAVWEYNIPRKRVGRKEMVNKIKFEPTEHQAGQAELVNVDVLAGYWQEKNTCSMITSKEKSKLLARVDRLLRGIKTARARANDQEVVKVSIAQNLFNYISPKQEDN